MIQIARVFSKKKWNYLLWHSRMKDPYFEHTDGNGLLTSTYGNLSDVPLKRYTAFKIIRNLFLLLRFFCGSNFRHHTIFHLCHAVLFIISVVVFRFRYFVFITLFTIQRVFVLSRTSSVPFISFSYFVLFLFVSFLFFAAFISIVDVIYRNWYRCSYSVLYIFLTVHSAS